MLVGSYRDLFLEIAMIRAAIILSFMCLTTMCHAMDGYDTVPINSDGTDVISYTVPRDEVKQLPAKERLRVLDIYGVGCWLKDILVADDNFCDFCEEQKPGIWDAKKIGPSFVRVIRNLKKWRQLMDLFQENALTIMSQSLYEKALENCVACGHRIRRTPMFWLYGSRNDLLELMAGTEVTWPKDESWGFQNLGCDPLPYMGPVFLLGVGSVVAKYFLTLPGRNNDRETFQQKNADSLNANYRMWMPETDFMQKAGCGAEYQMTKHANYTVGAANNGTLVNYPNSTDAVQEFCAEIGNDLRDFMNNNTHAFKPPYPVSDIDIYSVVAECNDQLSGKFNERVKHYFGDTQIYPIPYSDFKLPQKNIFTTWIRLYIPKTFPNASSYFEYAYRIVDPACWVNKQLGTIPQASFTDMYTKHGLLLGSAMVALDGVLILLPIAIVLGI